MAEKVILSIIIHYFVVDFPGEEATINKQNQRIYGPFAEGLAVWYRLKYWRRI